MKKSKIKLNYWIEWLIPVLFIVLIEIVQFFPIVVENWYSDWFYVIYARLLRLLTGWLPFSLGDILYVFFALIIVIKVIKGISVLFKKQFSWVKFWSGLLQLIRICMWIYIWFNLAWGLNYSRQGITHQLRLTRNEYHRQEVTVLTNQLIDQVNECRRQIKDTVLPQPSMNSIFTEANHCYDTIAREYSFLTYKNRSVKSSLYSPMGNYFGFTGYYNPFSGEAQVRNDVPKVLLPFIVCHEMAHQLGYASESEANFVGYLAASSSTNIFFRYSVYLDLFSYAQGEEIKLYLLEKNIPGLKATLLQNRSKLDTLVKKDRREIREYFYKRENKISPLVSNMYDQYLKLNKQMAGINSYNEVIGWLLAYQQKYRRL